MVFSRTLFLRNSSAHLDAHVVAGNLICLVACYIYVSLANGHRNSTYILFSSFSSFFDVIDLNHTCRRRSRHRSLLILSFHLFQEPRYLPTRLSI